MSSSTAPLTASTANTGHQSLAVAVIEIRTLLIDILADRITLPVMERTMRRRLGKAKREVLAECHRTFVRCFDIFYPTPPLKWEVLCRRLLLLRESDSNHHVGGKPNVDRYRYSYGSTTSSSVGAERYTGRLLLSAILAGLCQPSVNLRVTFSILLGPPQTQPVVGPSTSSRPQSTSSGGMLISRNRDMLASLIEQMTSAGTVANSTEGVGQSVGVPHLPDWHFRDVLELLLELVSDPVRRKLDRIGRHRRRGSSSSGSSNSNTSSASSCRSSEGVEYDYELEEDEGTDGAMENVGRCRAPSVSEDYDSEVVPEGRRRPLSMGGRCTYRNESPGCQDAGESDGEEDDSDQDDDPDDDQSQERLLIRNGCRLLAKLLSEIIHHGCDPVGEQRGDRGDQEDTTAQQPSTTDLMVPPMVPVGSNRLYSTGSRFGKIDLGKTWNTGNFGPDAIAFTVDRAGISIAGACVYSGSGSYEYQLELLYDSHHSSHSHTYSHSHRWEVLESIVGSYDQTAVRQHMAELRFNRAVLLKENHRYALRLCSQGARTLSGDCGQSSLRGPCGTVSFRFYPCDLSFNGTTPARGQIPAILYYCTPVGGAGSFQLGGANGGAGRELGNCRTQARDLALEVARAIVGRCRELLTVAHELALWTSASPGMRAPSSSETSSTPSSSASSGVVGIGNGMAIGGSGAGGGSGGGGVAIDSEHNITPIEEHLDVGTTGLVSVLSSNAAATTIERTRRTIGKVLPKGLLETLRGSSGAAGAGIPAVTPYDPYEIDSASEATVGGIGSGGGGGGGASGNAAGGVGMAANGNEMELPASAAVPMTVPMRKRTVWDLFRARTTRSPSVVNCLFRYLLPLTLAQLERCIRMDLKVSVEVLAMVQEVLPPITALNELRRQSRNGAINCSGVKSGSHMGHSGTTIGTTLITSSATSMNTTSQHYCILESDHPYRTAGLTAYRVRFPPTVRWMCLTFDAQCGTVQEEDRVKVKIPSRTTSDAKDPMDDWCTVRMYNTPSRWSYGGPGRAMVLPGREVEVSLESCSTYVNEPKSPAFGFKCLVIGYENADQVPSSGADHVDGQHSAAGSGGTTGGTLIALEHELAHLGGRCSRNLLRKELRFDDDPDDRLTDPEAATLERYGSTLLAKGLMVPDAMLTIRNALDCHLPVL
uniref:PHR domain-containing protein n=1 Tax=Anopheles atroparvus TaxID=41427 RepID=A0AAG5DHV8_ANOAO